MTRRPHSQRARAKRNAELIQQAKERGCAYCTSYDRLVFHHRDPASKSFNVTVGWPLRSFRKLEAEIDKCDVVCHCCHVEAHRLLRERARAEAASEAP